MCYTSYFYNKISKDYANQKYKYKKKPMYNIKMFEKLSNDATPAYFQINSNKVCNNLRSCLKKILLNILKKR